MHYHEHLYMANYMAKYMVYMANASKSTDIQQYRCFSFFYLIAILTMVLPPHNFASVKTNGKAYFRHSQLCQRF